MQKLEGVMTSCNLLMSALSIDNDWTSKKDKETLEKTLVRQITKAIALLEKDNSPSTILKPV